jgi:hypothetical protein
VCTCVCVWLCVFVWVAVCVAVYMCVWLCGCVAVYMCVRLQEQLGGLVCKYVPALTLLLTLLACALRLCV